jgi:hypothetical protein
MPRLTVPLGIKTAEGRASAFTSENIVNMYPEPARGQAKGQVALLSAPGLASFSTGGGGRVRGQININGSHFAVIGETLMSISSSGVRTTLATPVEGTGFVDMTAGNNALFIVSDLRSYTYGLSSGTFSEVLDPDFEQASSVAWVRQRIVTSVAGTGRMQIFDVDDETSVDALNFVTAESSSDNLVAVRASSEEIVALGSSSIEFWRPGDTPDEPLVRSLSSAPAEVGCLSRDSISLVNNGLMWLGRDRNSGGVAVFRMNGYTPERISTHAIENQIEKSVSFSAARSMSYALNGHLFYALTLPDRATFIFDATTQEWSQRCYGLWPVGQMPIADDGLMTFAMNGEKRIVGRSDGNLYELTLGAYSLGSDPLIREFTTPPLWPDTLTRTVSRVELVFEAGVGLTSGQGSNPQVMMSVSKDGGRTWSGPRVAMLGALGDYRARAYWTRLGSGRDWRLKFRVSDPVAFSVFNLWLDFEAGSS